MTSLGLVVCWKIVCCLFVFLLATGTARKRIGKDEVPPAEIDENGCECVWTRWMNNADYDIGIGDDTTYDNLRGLYDFCQTPKNIKCRDKYRWSMPYRLLHLKNTVCSVERGLTCVSKPYNQVRGTKEKPHYCADFEITVQCCTCTTTSIPSETTVTVATTADTEVKKISTNLDPMNELFPADMLSLFPEINNTAGGHKLTPDDKVPLTVILIVVFGCIVIAGFMVVIWLILTNKFDHKRGIPHQTFYQEAPMDEITNVTHESFEHLKPKVTFAHPERSSSDFLTTSDDEGYRSRLSHNQKRRTKGQRNRKLNNGNRGHGHASDSYEYPTLDSRTPTEDNSDEGRLRKWFPDEYERALEQKKRQQPVPKTRLLFNTPFNANSRKSIAFADDES